jgi:hypothetical protein
MDRTEDTEVTYEDYDTCHSVDPSFANETNDFLDESILLLHLLEKRRKNSEYWVSYLNKYSDYDTKHIILYNWIALSLIRDAHSDVAAVAVYRLKDKPARVYYAKNKLDSADESHVKEFADLVRLAASTSMSITDFQTRYFLLLHKNCLAKLERRVDALRASVTLRAKPLKDQAGDLIVMPSQGDQLRNLLQTAINTNSIPPLRRNRADTEALNMTPKTKNVFISLLTFFDSMKLFMGTEITADMLENLCGHCWIIGSSGILEEMTRSNHAAHNVVTAASKLGEYYRGIARLFNLFNDEGMRASLSTFDVLAVPPKPNRNVELFKNWYHVMETVYVRVEGKNMAITRDKLYAALQSEMLAYVKYTGGFTRHAEVNLIEHLINQNLPPTVVGISKLSCALCNAWIDSLNRENVMKWRVNGCHGRCYAWARNAMPGPMTAGAEANVKTFVYRRLVDILSTFIPDLGESPAHRYDATDEQLSASPFRMWN